MYPVTPRVSSTGQISYVLSETQNIRVGTSVTATIKVASNASAGPATFSLYLSGVTKDIAVNIIKKVSMTIPPISKVANDIIQKIKIPYKNENDGDTTDITIIKTEPKGLQANIIDKTANDFVVSISPSSSYVGLVSITISALNAAGVSTVTLVLKLVVMPSITFANYNHLVTHSSSAKKIPFTGLVGKVVGVNTITPRAHSVITNVRVNGSNIEFNTKGQAGKEHILVTVLNDGITKAVQLFIQVMQERVANFSTAISTTYLSADGYDTRDSVVGDLDGDSDLDIAIAVYGGANYWYKNNGSGVFTKQVSFDSSSNNSKGIDIGDLDGDGDLDLFVVNTGQNDYIYLNNGSGSFSQRRVNSGGEGRDISLGDIDNDGDLDAYVSNFSNKQNKLWLNDGSANFIVNDIANDLGASFSSDLGDVDNDGDLDIYVANFNQENKLWLNQGSNNFVAGNYKS